jgi:molybdate transport system permease protein
MPAQTPKRRRSPPLLELASLPFLLFLGLPLMALLYRASLEDIAAALLQEAARQAIQLSLITTLVSLGVTVVTGTPVAYWLARHPSRGKRILDTLIDLPSVLPPAVAGLALLMTFGRLGLLGAYLYPLGVRIPFTAAAVVMAQTFVAGPLYVRAAAIGFAGLDSELEDAAALDGSSQWQTFWQISVPICSVGLVSGLVSTWARALGEFGATILFAGNFPGRTQTMPLAIYLGFEQDINVALALSAILVGVSFVTLLLVKVVLRRVDHE